MKKKQLKFRVLAVLATIAMVFGVMPAGVFAASPQRIGIMPLAAVNAPTTAVRRTATEHWVGAWSSSQYYGDPASGNGGIRSAGEVARDQLPNATLRQLIRTAIAGETIRVTFSNEFGETPLTINAASIARASGNPGTSNIDTNTNTPITFDGGERRVVIPPGEFATSDNLDFSVDALERLAISTYFGTLPDRVTSHIAARANSFVQPGNNITAATISGTTNTHWFVLCNVDVIAPLESRSIVVLGDSITDGFGVTNEAYTRWVDILMNNLQDNDATRHLSVINMGIGGNGLLGSAFSNPPAARHLFPRDVLEQPGVGYVVFQIGVNNFAFSPSVEADDMIAAYTELIKSAHANGIKVFAGTITPYDEDRAAREEGRQAVNNWMRQQYADGRIYGLIDFDMILRDPYNHARLLPAFDRDGIHPTNPGYSLMGETMFELLYESITADDYRLTVTAGEGASRGGSFAAGTSVTVSAGEAPEGFYFRSWTSPNPNIDFEDAESESTSFSMPSMSTAVIANFGRIGGDLCDNCGVANCDDSCADWEFVNGMEHGLRTFSVRPVGGFIEGNRYRITFEMTPTAMPGMRVRWAGAPAPDHNGPWVDGDIVNTAPFQAGTATTFGYVPAHFTGMPESGVTETFTVEFTFTTEGLSDPPAGGDFWAVISGSQQSNNWEIGDVIVTSLEPS